MCLCSPAWACLPRRSFVRGWSFEKTLPDPAAGRAVSHLAYKREENGKPKPGNVPEALFQSYSRNTCFSNAFYGGLTYYGYLQRQAAVTRSYVIFTMNVCLLIVNYLSFATFVGPMSEENGATATTVVQAMGHPPLTLEHPAIAILPYGNMYGAIASIYKWYCHTDGGNIWYDT